MSLSLHQPSGFLSHISRSWSSYNVLQYSTSVSPLIEISAVPSLTHSLSSSHNGLLAVFLFLAHTRHALALGLALLIPLPLTQVTPNSLLPFLGGSVQFYLLGETSPGHHIYNCNPNLLHAMSTLTVIFFTLPHITT